MSPEKVINTLFGVTKKTGMKEEHSPFGIPYKKKARGKETRPGFFQKQDCSKTARARVRARTRACTCTYGEAGAAAAEILGNCFGDFDRDFAIWSWYCRHFNRGLIVDKAYEFASRQRQGEISDAVTAFQHWLAESFPRKEVRQ